MQHQVQSNHWQGEASPSLVSKARPADVRKEQSKIAWVSTDNKYGLPESFFMDEQRQEPRTQEPRMQMPRTSEPRI